MHIHFFSTFARKNNALMNSTKGIAAATFITMLLAIQSAKAQQVQAQNILQVLQEQVNGQGTVTINQSQHISQLLNDRLWRNAQKPGMEGFRIRIFSETGQNARENSQLAIERFANKYPGVNFYQAYDKPYRKVSVGDFRTRESAQKFYQQVRNDFPKAFLVSDWINFPDLD